MIDSDLLRSFGWSDELIGAATLMAKQVADAAVVGTVGSALDIGSGSPAVGSQRADVSGPPVATPQLHVASNR